MKELRIEEKAKRYDEVVDEIKKLRDMLLKEGVINKDGIICDNFNRIFPELKESEDEKIRKDLITFLDDVWHLGKDANFGKWDKADCSDWINWLEKQGGQKPAEWSEEDKVILNNIIRSVHMKSIKPLDEMNAMSKYKKYEDFLKSLPARFSLQPKAEWSEEDEQNLNEALSYIKDDALKEFIKSLRPQKQWKPSKKQMEYLLKYGEQNNYDGAILTSLYNELKQL